MLIEFACDCGHNFRTQGENAGMPIVCPNCTAKLHVPIPASIASSVADSETPLRSMKVDTPTVAPVKNPSRKSSEVAKRPSESNKSAPKKSPSPAPEKPIERDESSLFADLGPMEAPEESEEELPEFTPTRRRRTSNKKRDEEKESEQKSKQSGSKKGTVLLTVGIIAVGTLLLGTIGFFAVPPMLAAIKAAGKVKVPQEFEKYTDNDISFQFQHPKGWTPIARGGSGNIPPSIRFEQGNIKVSFRASNSGAAIQDMTQAMSGQAGELPDELKPVARVHDFQKAKFSDEMPGYTELGPVEKIETGLGEGRLSTFVASGSFGGRLYGYRATLLSTNFQWNIVCQTSSQHEFSAYKAIFKKMIESVGR